MNIFRSLMQETDFDNADVARLLNLDVATVILFDLKVGLVNLDTALSLCSLLDVSFFDMFPALEDLAPEMDADAEPGDEVPFIYSLFEQSEYHPRLLGCGIDPDIRLWYVSIQFKSGVERRYRLSSLDKTRLDITLSEATKADSYFVFHADCQTVIIRRSAVQDVRFSNGLSYAQFSSDERGFAMTVMMPHMHQPSFTSVPCDDVNDGGFGTPLRDLIDLARADAELPSFLRFTDGEETRLLQIDGFEVLEIPVGLTIPNFYRDDSEIEDESPAEILLKMEAMGSA